MRVRSEPVRGTDVVIDAVVDRRAGAVDREDLSELSRPEWGRPVQDVCLEGADLRVYIDPTSSSTGFSGSSCEARHTGYCWLFRGMTEIVNGGAAAGTGRGHLSTGR